MVANEMLAADNLDDTLTHHLDRLCLAFRELEELALDARFDG